MTLTTAYPHHKSQVRSFRKRSSVLGRCPLKCESREAFSTFPGDPSDGPFLLGSLLYHRLPHTHRSLSTQKTPKTIKAKILHRQSLLSDRGPLSAAQDLFLHDWRYLHIKILDSEAETRARATLSMTRIQCDLEFHQLALPLAHPSVAYEHRSTRSTPSPILSGR